MQNLGDTLKLMQSSTMWTWGSQGSVDIYIDDYKTDTRLVYHVKLYAGCAPSYSVARLESYDKKQNKWLVWVGENYNTNDMTRTGEKALREYIKSKALEQCSLIPYPARLTVIN